MEIEEFVNNKKLFRQIGWYFERKIIGRIESRVLAMKLYFLKKITFRDLCRNLLPDSFFAENNYKKVFHVIEDELLKKINFTLFGKEMQFHESRPIRYFGDLYYIIILDQYHAREYIQADSVVIDAGANFGIFSSLAASIAEKGKVYAFEPVAETYSYLAQNTADYKNIQCVNLALGESNKDGEISFNPKDLQVSSLKDSGYHHFQENFYNNHHDIKVVTLDSFVRENKIEKLDFLKIDTEGYEKEILIGAKKSIKKFKPVIAVSAYHQQNDTKDIVELINAIDPKYKHKLSFRGEEDFIFYHE